jgi:hypothetical protein
MIAIRPFSSEPVSGSVATYSRLSSTVVRANPWAGPPMSTVEVRSPLTGLISSSPFASATPTCGSESIDIPASRPSSIAFCTFVCLSAPLIPATISRSAAPASRFSYVAADPPSSWAMVDAAAFGSSTAPGALTRVGAVPAGPMSATSFSLTVPSASADTGSSVRTLSSDVTTISAVPPSGTNSRVIAPSTWPIWTGTGRSTEPVARTWSRAVRSYVQIVPSELPMNSWCTLESTATAAAPASGSLATSARVTRSYERSSDPVTTSTRSPPWPPDSVGSS